MIKKRKKMKMCKDSHHHNFFLYSYCSKIKDACMHACFYARYNKHKQMASKQTEEERVEVWLFVDVFFLEQTIVARAILFVLHLIHYYFLCYYIYTILVAVTHTYTHCIYPFYVWLVSISSSLYGKRQTIQKKP